MTPTEEQIEQGKLIEELVLYLRDMLKKRTRDFVDFQLDEIAKNSGMPDELKDTIKKALDDPTKEFTVKFKPTKTTNHE